MRVVLPRKGHTAGLLVSLLGLLGLTSPVLAQGKKTAPAPLHALGAGSPPHPNLTLPSTTDGTACLSMSQVIILQQLGTLPSPSKVPACASTAPKSAAQIAIDKAMQPAAAPKLQVEASETSGNSLLPGGGFSGFLLAPSYQATPTPLNYTATVLTLSADFRMTGHNDIVTIDSGANLHFLANNGDGSFAAPVNTSLLVPGSYYTGFISAITDDFDKDGYPDIIARDSNYGRIVFLRNDHSGGFTQTKIIKLPVTYSSGLLMLGDVNGDGVDDLIASTTSFSYATSNTTLQIFTYVGDGSGGFNSTPIETDYEFDQTMVIVPNGGGVLGKNASHSSLYLEALTLGTYGIDGATVFALPVSGDGTFGDTPYNQQEFVSNNIYVTSYSSGLSIQDLNGDGTPDLTLSFMDGNIYTALGETDGSFPIVTVANQSFDVYPQAWALTDIDGDGIPDFVLKDVDSLEVLPGLGTGKFGNAPAYYSVASSANGQSNSSPGTNMVVKDFDGDGTLDIVYVDGSYTGNSRAYMLHGYGDGTYFAAPTLPTNNQLGYDSGHLYSQAMFDTNGDGYADIIALDTYGLGNYPYRTALSDGKGNFTFIKALDGAYGNYSIGYTLKSADMNQDGLTDLLLDASSQTSSGSYNHTLAVALSKGDGTFKTPTFLDMNGTALTSSLRSVAVGDINGDGTPDIVAVTTGGYYDAPAIITFLGNGDGTFKPANTQSFGYSYTYAGVSLADLNGDGKLDLLISDDGKTGSVNPTLYVIFGTNSGTFDTSTAQIVVSGLSIRNALIGDLNGDGSPDLALFSAGQQNGYSVNTTNRGLLIYLNDGHGNFSFTNTFEAGVLSGKGLLQDLNGDGKLDVIYTTDYPSDIPAGDNAGAQLLLGKGDGTFGAPTNLGLEPGISTLFAGDIDGDGTPDLMAWAYYYGSTAVIRNISGISLTINADSKTIVQGNSVTLSASVTPAVDHRPIPSGTVEFFANGTSIGTATLQAGAATLSVSSLAVGSNTITATYSGDTAFSATKAGATLLITVTAPATVTPDFLLTPAATSITLSRGSSGVMTFAISANAGFSGSLNFTTADLPSGMSVLFSPSTISLSPSGTANGTVVVSTTSSEHASSSSSALAWMLAMPLTGFLIFFKKSKRKAMKKLMLAGFALASCGTLMFLSGCSDSPVRSTKTGDYTIVVKATPSVSGVAAKAFNVTVHVE